MMESQPPMRNHGYRTESALTLTDLERLCDQDPEVQTRSKVEPIPILLRDGGPGPGRAAAGGKAAQSERLNVSMGRLGSQGFRCCVRGGG